MCSKFKLYLMCCVLFFFNCVHAGEYNRNNIGKRSASVAEVCEAKVARKDVLVPISDGNPLQDQPLVRVATPQATATKFLHNLARARCLHAPEFSVDYIRLRQILWNPENFFLIRFALDNKIITTDSILFAPRMFFAIPYEAGYKLLRDVEPDTHWQGVHRVSLQGHVPQEVVLARLMKENPPVHALNDGLKLAIKHLDFQGIYAMLSYGADPQSIDRNFLKTVQFHPSNAFYILGKIERTLKHAHWIRLINVAFLMCELFQQRDIPQDTDMFELSLKIAQYHYGMATRADKRRIMSYLNQCWEADGLQDK